ncbi:MAG TPA: glycosyltransferase family 39 protein, partial [Nitrosopumilaceae archaeon]|nr:glycosyltransferase family 39 protein [Nitrosopumilaceae archaeon]
MNQKQDFVIIAVLAVIVFNTCFNLQGFPEYFWDEGVYVERAINFLKTSQIYPDPNYIDHPPLGWIIPSVFFGSMGFPDSIIHLSKTSNLEQQILMLFLIPRLIGVLFTVLTSILIYKISMTFYNNRNFAITSLVIFALVPAIWPLRNLLLDPMMIMFILLSLFVLLPKPFNNVNKNVSSTKISYKIFLSGILFGIAFLVKLSAVFFLPAIMLFAVGYGIGLHQSKKVTISNSHVTVEFSEQLGFKQRVSNGALWLAPVFAGLGAWILFLYLYEHTLSHLVSTQIWQTERPSTLPYGTALKILFLASPAGLVFGVIGLIQILKNKNQRIWSVLALPYIGFLFRGGFVGFVHVIPMLPILSIFAGKPLYQLLEKRTKTQLTSYRKQANYFIAILLVVSIGVTIWIASFDAAKPDRDAIQFLIKNLPKNSVLITDPGYGWAVKAFRPDVKVTDYFTL